MRNLAKLPLLLLLFTACGEPGADPAANNSADAGGAQPVWLTVVMAGEGQGHIEINDEVCSDSPCAVELPPGDQVKVEASAPLASTFVGWDPDCGEGVTCELTMSDRDLELTASFAIAGELKNHQSIREAHNTTLSLFDAAGDTYVVGSYRNSPPFDLEESGDLYRGYLAKVAPDGSALWAKSFTLNGTDTTYKHMQLSGDGALYLLATKRNSTGGQLQKIDTNTGEIVWAIDTTTKPSLLAVDGNGNIFVTGVAAGVDKFGSFYLGQDGTNNTSYTVRVTPTGAVSPPTILPGKLSPVGLVGVPGGGAVLSRGSTTSAELVRLRADGSFVSSAPFPVSGPMAVAPNGEFIMASSYTHSFPWGSMLVPEPSDRSLFVGRLTAEGTPTWIYTAQSQSPDTGFASDFAIFTEPTAQGLTVAPDGSIYVAGVLGGSGTVDFGNGSQPRVADYEGFILGLSRHGEHRWSQTYGSPDDGTFVPRFMGLTVAGSSLLCTINDGNNVSTPSGPGAPNTAARLEFQR